MCADIRPDNVWRCIHGRELVLSLTILPPTIHNVARRKLRMIAAAKEVKDLRVPPGNNLEQLVGNLAGLWSIRINDQWRIVFTFENGGADNVRITDYH